MTTFEKPRIAVVGAGLGGAFAAALLQAQGYQVEVYEQADQIARIGAGIHLSPNYVRALMRIGILRELMAKGAEPLAFVSRELASDATLFRLPLGESAWLRYGAPYLTIHRADLHEALVSRIVPGTLHLGKCLCHVQEDEAGVQLAFEDGTRAHADAVIGADGLNSRVRAILHGDESPVFGKHVAYRAQVPTSLLRDVEHYALTKWWSDRSFLISYFMSDQREVVYFAAGIPREEWGHAAPWVQSTREELLGDLGEVSDNLARLVRHAEDVSLWPLYQRAPIAEWGRGRIVLLGDACHPMQPHMAQGAAMATEDAALLLRFLQSGRYDDVREAFVAYARFRLPRTSKVQAISNENRWLRSPVDADWLYGYDAMSCDLDAPDSGV